MNFKKIDMDNWDRKENYAWFTTKNRCKINMTMNVDATRLIKIIKENNLRHYPVFTYIVSKVINRNDEFKMNYDEEGNLGIYDVVHPRYPIFHESDKRLSILWTEYSDDFRVFYDRFINDINTYGEIRSMAAKGKYPPNCFDMSSLPWCSFTSFDCPPTNDIVWLFKYDGEVNLKNATTDEVKEAKWMTIDEIYKLYSKGLMVSNLTKSFDRVVSYIDEENK